MTRNGVTFNEWNLASQKYGVGWIEDQLTVLEKAVENAKQLEEYNGQGNPIVPIGKWKYKG